MIYLQVYLAFCKVGLFSIGGGYAALPLIENIVVKKHAWLTMLEFGDLITISQMTPGPIAINAATFVGARVGGVFGSIIATLGFLTPSIIIVLFLSFLYVKYKNLQSFQAIMNGIRPSVIAFIAVAGIGILSMAIWGETKTEPTNFVSIFLIILSLVAIRRFKVDPVVVILASGVVGYIIYSALGIAV